MGGSWHRYAVLDVFTEKPLEGNPVAVFPHAAGLGGEVMQRVARELCLSETVFVLDAEPGCDARVRIFTPLSELPFAGHPVLGTAFLLGQDGDAPVVRLGTAAGVVPVALRREGGRIAFGEMEQPIPVAEEFPHTEALLGALRIQRPELPIGAYRNGPLHLFLALSSPDVVTGLVPDLSALAALGPLGVSCFALAGDHVRTRMFAPGLGVPEDPATGSAAGPLALHLVRHGALEYGRDLEIRQGTEIGRPSTLRARVEGSSECVQRVAVGGSAVLVARGEYRLA